MRSIRAWTALVLALSAPCAACLVPLDRRPPERAFFESKAALASAARKVRSDHGAVRVGWGRAEMVLPPGAPLGGYGSFEGAPHTGVHDPVFAKAIAIAAGDGAPVVLLGLDLLLTDPATANAVRERVRDVVDPSRLVFTASHTHCGPGGFAEGLAMSLVFGSRDQAAFDAVTGAIERAIREATAKLEPGSVAWAEIDAPGLNVNRTRKSGQPVDPFAAVLLARRAADQREAALVIYPAHATVVSDLILEVSADYPGVMQRSLESSAGGDLDLAAFAAGAVGSMAPRAGWSEQPGAKWQGEAMARAVRTALPALRRSLRSETSLAVIRFPAKLPKAQWRLFDEWAIHASFAGMFASPTMYVQAVSFGRDTLVSLPVELSGEIASDLRRRARERGELLAITTFNGEYGGYVVPRSAYDLPDDQLGEMGEYESHLMSFYGPWMADLFAAITWHAMQEAQRAAVEGHYRVPARGPTVRASHPGEPPPEPPRPPGR